MVSLSVNRELDHFRCSSTCDSSRSSTAILKTNDQRHKENDNDDETYVVREKPKRPLSAYNMFFRDQREALLKSLPAPPKREDGRRPKNSHGKINFKDLAQTIAARWKQICPAEKKRYEEIAEVGRKKYREVAKKWKEQQRQEGLLSKTITTVQNQAPVAPTKTKTKRIPSHEFHYPPSASSPFSMMRDSRVSGVSNDRSILWKPSTNVQSLQGVVQADDGPIDPPVYPTTATGYSSSFARLASPKPTRNPSLSSSWRCPDDPEQQYMEFQSPFTFQDRVVDYQHALPQLNPEFHRGSSSSSNNNIISSKHNSMPSSVALPLYGCVDATNHDIFMSQDDYDPPGSINTSTIAVLHGDNHYFSRHRPSAPAASTIDLTQPQVNTSYAVASSLSLRPTSSMPRFSPSPHSYYENEENSSHASRSRLSDPEESWIEPIPFDSPDAFRF